MNVKAVIPLVAGLGIGGFALKMGIDTMQRAKGTPTESTQIWAAKGEIPRGTRIREEMIAPLTFPAKLVPTGAVKQKDQLIGRVPKVDAPGGLPILDGMLFPPGDPGGIHVPPGFRAVAVKIDEASGVDYHVLPGSHVDVVGYFTLRTGSGNRQETIARTVIENVEVAAVGARLSASTNEGEEKNAKPARAVTLLVPSDKVPILHLVEQRGRIKLSMRGDADAGKILVADAISESELLDPDAATRRKQEQEPSVADSTATPTPTPGISDWVKGLFAKPAPTSPPVVAAVPPPVLTPVLPTVPEWVVDVYRGGKHEVVRFKDRDSRERVGPIEDTNSRGAKARSNSTARPSGSTSAAPAATPASAPPTPPTAAPAPAPTPAPVEAAPVQPEPEETNDNSQESSE